MAKGLFITGKMIELVYIALSKYSNSLYSDYLSDLELFKNGKLSKSDFDESVLDTLSDINVLEKKILNECNFSETTKRLLAMVNSEDCCDVVRVDIPCKVGDTVYFLDDKIVVEGRSKKPITFVNKGTVDHITLGSMMIPILTVCTDENIWIDFNSVDDWGVIAFSNESDAVYAMNNRSGE